MKSLMQLWRELAEELASWCHTSTALDYKKLESRVKEEGFSFLTITLPTFAKDLERCLDAGAIDATAFPGFKRRGGLPLFLGGFLALIFDSSSGLLLERPNVDAIFAVRQLCYLYQKIELKCSDARTAHAMKGYIQIEEELKEKYEQIPAEKLSAFRRISSLLYGDVFAALDSLVADLELSPRHGPGSTADGLFANAKFDQHEWTSRLERVLPFGELAIPNWRYYYQLDHVEFLEPDAERPVKVIPVPKTLKTPRIIAVEPTCMQYTQQALTQPLVEMLEAKRSPSIRGVAQTRDNLAFGFIGFTDQIPNRDLASVASVHGRMATLDLSEASDRVLNQLVIDLLHRFPHFSEAVQATRSTKASVPVGTDRITVDLVKFASMGSALCFPIEAMVFLTTIFVGIEAALGKPLTRRDILSFRGKVRVYGDDIIVPTDMVVSVISHLEMFSFKVNLSKSFWTGKFRESCGGDYYDGEWVTPVRFRQKWPSSLKDASEVISLVEFRNLLFMNGCWTTTRWLDEKIGKILPHYPFVRDTSPGLGRLTFSPILKGERWDEKLQRPIVKAFVVNTRPPRSNVSGEGALLKCLLRSGDEPFQDPRHLERSGRPRAVGIKPAWVPLY